MEYQRKQNNFAQKCCPNCEFSANLGITPHTPPAYTLTSPVHCVLKVTQNATASSWIKDARNSSKGAIHQNAMGRHCSCFQNVCSWLQNVREMDR